MTLAPSLPAEGQRESSRSPDLRSGLALLCERAESLVIYPTVFHRSIYEAASVLSQLAPSHRIVPGPSICVQGMLRFCDAHCGSVHILHTPVCGAYPRFPCVYRSNAASLPSHRSRSLHLRSGKCRVRGRCIKSYILRCFTVAYTACCPALSQPAASSPSHRSQPSHFAFREMPCKQEGGPSRHISYGVSL